MARPTHYETLGLRSSASEKEIRAAYRRTVLKHHPDRSSDPASARIFLAATEAYEVLIDPSQRRSYDQGIENEQRRAAERRVEETKQKDAASRVRAAQAASNAPPAAGTSTTAPGTPLPTQLARLSMFFSRGLYAEAEKLADEIVQRDPRQPLPYAIKGDLARQRGKMDEAARQYSLAIQMDPRNPTYLQRYEEVLRRANVTPEGTSRIDPGDRFSLAVLALGLIILLAAVYVVISPERSALKGLGPVASWTVGVAAMLFVSGIAVGSCLSAGGGLDRLEASATGRIVPTVALGIVSVISFPVAALLYVILGLIQRGFNQSTTRIMIGVGASVAAMAGAAAISRSGIAPVSVLLWGGNVAYLGALCGWAVADGVRG